VSNDDGTRTASKTTSGGNRNPTNDGDSRRRRITRARYDPHPIHQRNSATTNHSGTLLPVDRMEIDGEDTQVILGSDRDNGLYIFTFSCENPDGVWYGDVP
jgi:hypothetical protein